MRPPDLVNDTGTIRAYRYVTEPGIGPADWQAGLASWYVEADPGVLDPLGVFTSWFVGGVSLRDVPGVRPAYRQYPEAQYELLCCTIDPTKGVTADVYERRTSGDLALEAFVRAVVLGGLSPSRPVDLSRGVFDVEWRRRLTATVEHFATGHWPSVSGAG